MHYMLLKVSGKFKLQKIKFEKFNICNTVPRDYIGTSSDKQN